MSVVISSHSPLTGAREISILLWGSTSCQDADPITRDGLNHPFSLLLCLRLPFAVFFVLFLRHFRLSFLLSSRAVVLLPLLPSVRSMPDFKIVLLGEGTSSPAPLPLASSVAVAVAVAAKKGRRNDDERRPRPQTHAEGREKVVWARPRSSCVTAKTPSMRATSPPSRRRTSQRRSR